MQTVKLFIAAGLVALPAIARAQPVTGLYIGAGAGVNFTEEGSVLSNRPLASAARANNLPTTGTGGFETGFAGVVSAGWGFGNGLRVEIEGNARRSETAGRNTINGSGIGSIYGVMGNVFYDISIPGVPWVMPYIGVGAGYAWRNMDAVRVTSRTQNAGFVTSDTVGVFAYQAIAGVAFPISTVPGLSVTAEYRYFSTEDAYFDARAFRPGNGATIGAGQLKSGSTNHSALLGLRYAFNAPRPAAVVPVVVAPPAQSPARTYLVFFDWDRADLTDRARQIIADAAQNARTVSSTRIEVSGHADRTGTAVYNQRLSVRRGEAVAAELVRRGIARNEITVQGFGFDRPLVPTAMGVREPQNRRVEIVLR